MITSASIGSAPGFTGFSSESFLPTGMRRLLKLLLPSLLTPNEFVLFLKPSFSLTELIVAFNCLRSRGLCDTEKTARINRVGLWSDRDPIPPWEWRHGSSNKGQVSIKPVTASDKSSVYHGNAKSRIFHTLKCRYYNCKSCTAVFKTQQEAIKAGYRPCKICKP